MQKITTSHRVFGFAGWSGSGKTTLIEKLITDFSAQGLRVSLIKHAHHEFDIDQAGKDSHRHRVAGAHEVMVSSKNRWALIHELRSAQELSLNQVLSKVSSCDLIFVEGYKTAAIPKLEVYRPELGKPLLYQRDTNILGVATSDPSLQASIPKYALTDITGIGEFIRARVGLLHSSKTKVGT